MITTQNAGKTTIFHVYYEIKKYILVSNALKNIINFKSLFEKTQFDQNENHTGTRKLKKNNNAGTKQYLRMKTQSYA